jgi:transposase
MSINTSELPDDVESLKDIINEQRTELDEQRYKYSNLEEKYNEKYQELLILEEKFLVLQKKFFGKSSEKFDPKDDGQKYLFNEAEDCAAPVESEVIEEEITVKEHSRKKTGKKPLPDNLPREEIVYDLSEKEKKCECCGKYLPEIGREVSEELDIIPAQIKVNRHIRLKYGSCGCEESFQQEKPEVKTAKMPERFLPYSIVSPGLLAYVLVCKFCDALPFYRMEKIFERIGVDISRQTMCNWMMNAANKLQQLRELMLRFVLSSPFIQMDETILQVLRDENGNIDASNSYMWLTLGNNGNKKMILFHYSPTRGKIVPLEILKSYKGYLQTDGYGGYTEIGKSNGIIHVGCWAHARRYFTEAAGVSKNANSANEALSYIRELYGIEKSLRNSNLSDEEFVKKRKEKVISLLEKFRNWLIKKQIQVPPKTKIGEAVSYTLSEWEKLICYLDAPFLTPDNNAAENAIRPFVIGRKNWLFSNTPNGAAASATIYSLIESAKANGLEPYRYLRYLFTKLPEAKTEYELGKLLPTEVEKIDTGLV